jgi:hypothetical protein
MKWKFKIIKNNSLMPFLYRLSLYFKNGSIKLHVITGDDSKVFHTHPWDFTSFILFGGYKEWQEVIDHQSYIDWYRIKGMDNSSEYNRINIKYHYRTFSINKKLHTELHRVELFKLFGIKVPCITIGFYSNKIELCSFCKELGYCKSNKKP